MYIQGSMGKKEWSLEGTKFYTLLKLTGICEYTDCICLDMPISFRLNFGR